MCLCRVLKLLCSFPLLWTYFCFQPCVFLLYLVIKYISHCQSIVNDIVGHICTLWRFNWSKSWQQSHQCQRERQKNLQCRLHWGAFPSFFSNFYPPLVCKQSLSSSCTHLTPNPSDKAHSAVGATSRGSRYREIVHHNGFRLLPAFSEPCSPPSCVSSHTSLMPPPLPFFPFECSKRGLGIFTLRLLLSTSSDWNSRNTHERVVCN